MMPHLNRNQPLSAQRAPLRRLGAMAVGLMIAVAGAQTPTQMQPVPRPPNRPVPTVATTIPAQGVHLASEVGAFKIKRGSEAPNYGDLLMTFRGTVLVSGLNGTATPSNGARLEFEQPKFKKQVFFSKGVGTLKVVGQFGGIQFFGQKVNAYYKGDGVITLYGEFDRNLNTGLYWYDQTPNDKKYWGTNGMTITPTPITDPNKPGQLKIKDVPAKG